MGYIIKEIAKIREPKMVSPSDVPNYVEFENNKNINNNTYAQINLTVINDKIPPIETQNNDVLEKHIASHSTIRFREESTSIEHIIKGTKNVENINSSTYFIDEDDTNSTMNNIKDCLLKNSFLGSNYSISVSMQKVDNNNAIMHNVIYMKSLGAGKNYIINFQNEESDNNKIVKFTVYSPSSSNNDSIFNGSPDASIELEVYTDTKSQLGENEFPETSLGTYMTTLRKSYHGQPLWFDINALMSNKSTFKNEFLNATGWCDAGTATDYRFIARRFDGKNREPFYLSDVVYNITGYNRNLGTNDLDKFVYNAQNKNIVQPLTNQPTLYHVKGQTQYFNFILSDSDRQKNHQTGITYKLYTQSKALINEGTIVSQGEKLSVVNTINLNIDGVIGQRKNVGYVEVYLNVANEIQSHPLTFRILPECLYSANDFAFLNALGGWSSFNFGGEKKTDFKASATTIFKTQTPQHTISSEIESVYSQDIKEQFSVKTMPIDASTVEWLKEMSASMAVYELSSKRYIIMDEMNIKPNSKDELFEVEMKYRYSDSFNGRIK